jgi:TRAP-type uncharacterized transport system substrate-binding protein
MLRVQGGPDWPVTLFGSSTIEGVEAVVKGEAHLAIINPASALALAVAGKGIFTAPQPVLPITVIPSYDNYVFAVKSELGLTRFEEIGEKRVPLRLSLRGQKDHWLHYMLDDIAAAAGFKIPDIVEWGGQVTREGLLPYPNGPKFEALRAGRIDAIFDEAANVWVDQASDAGLTILPLAEETVRKLEAMGYRRGIISKTEYPKLPADVLTLEFCGWPIFVHADAPEDFVRRVCTALEARKHLIPWQGEGPLPLERMCIDGPETPQTVRLHPAAEKFWRERGYLS